jgi:alkanesulfonate monooxygenase SsuD/methylene tetrahydromethanopterin reductase-like flavin-dependent oxidoreductase (luciferase family)
MDIDIILEPDVAPQQMAELAVEAERLGIRAIWSSNYHQDWDCFLALAPAAAATSKIILGALAVSPWELHPLKMANAVLSLNEMSNGRAMIAISGGGGVLGATGWRIGDGPVWPRKDPDTQLRNPERRVRAVRECIEVLEIARSGKLAYSYDGEIFQVLRPFVMNYAQAETGPLIYGCCSGPQMIRMGARLADGIQVSDFTVDMMPNAMESVRAGLRKREKPVDARGNDQFRVGNFWAFHIKQDPEVAMYEARRELIWRGAVVAKYAHDIAPHVDGDDEVQAVIDNWDNFFKAFWTRSGKIDGISNDIVEKLIAGMSSAGGLDALDAEIERYRAFAASGLTELSLRLFDDPMDGLNIIGEHVLPALRP